MLRRAERQQAEADAPALKLVEDPARGRVCTDDLWLEREPSRGEILADLLVRSLVERRCRIATTSNTVPGELGAGRMAARAASMTKSE